MKTTDSTPTPNPPTPKAFINALNKGKIKKKQKKKESQQKQQKHSSMLSIKRNKERRKKRKPTKTTKAFFNASYNQKQKTKKQHNTNTLKTNQTHNHKTRIHHKPHPNNTKPNIVPYKTNSTTKLKNIHPIKPHTIPTKNFHLIHNKMKIKPNILTKVRPTGLTLKQEINNTHNNSKNTNKCTSNNKGNITSKEYTSPSIKTKVQTSYPKAHLKHTTSLHTIKTKTQNNHTNK